MRGSPVRTDARGVSSWRCGVRSRAFGVPGLSWEGEPSYTQPRRPLPSRRSGAHLGARRGEQSGAERGVPGTAPETRLTQSRRGPRGARGSGVPLGEYRTNRQKSDGGNRHPHVGRLYCSAEAIFPPVSFQPELLGTHQLTKLKPTGLAGPCVTGTFTAVPAGTGTAQLRPTSKKAQNTSNACSAGRGPHCSLLSKQLYKVGSEQGRVREGFT